VSDREAGAEAALVAAAVLTVLEVYCQGIKRRIKKDYSN
jgi:hypothetical protein